jgi:3-oxoacyl-[acyl-carrier protein] reductase
MGEPYGLEGRCVLVTGGSMGIGFAVAEECLRVGARVGICARTHADLDDAVGDLKGRGYSDVAGFPCDVTNLNQLESTLDALESSFGPLAGVVHAAGIYGPIGTIVEVDPEAWFDAIEVNLFGSFLVSRQAALRFIRNGGGRIALFSGGGAATPFPNYTAYACSKIGVVRLTETIAAELAPHNIEVNCIAPGFVITRLHEQTLAAGARAGAKFLETTQAQIEKGGVPAAVGARAAAFLISDAARGITGKFVAAPYDGLEEWPEHLQELAASDLFTLRRIVPRDRGLDWQ